MWTPSLLQTPTSKPLWLVRILATCAMIGWRLMSILQDCVVSGLRQSTNHVQCSYDWTILCVRPTFYLGLFNQYSISWRLGSEWPFSVLFAFHLLDGWSFESLQCRASVQCRFVGGRESERERGGVGGIPRDFSLHNVAAWCLQRWQICSQPKAGLAGERKRSGLKKHWCNHLMHHTSHITHAAQYGPDKIVIVTILSLERTY